jgi:hypothetical protein
MYPVYQLLDPAYTPLVLIVTALMFVYAFLRDFR